MFGGKKQNNLSNQQRTKSKTRNRWFHIASFIAAIISAGFLVVSLLPTNSKVVKIPLNDRQFKEAGLTTSEDLPWVKLTAPTNVWVGDSMDIQMQFVPAGLQIEENINLVAEFNLTLNQARFTPDGSINYPLKAGYPAQATWHAVSLKPGLEKGQVWVHLQIIESGKEIQRFLLLVTPVEFKSNTLLGLPPFVVRIICTIILVVCLGLNIILLISNRMGKPVQSPHKRS